MWSSLCTRDQPFCILAFPFACAVKMKIKQCVKKKENSCERPTPNSQRIEIGFVKIALVVVLFVISFVQFLLCSDKDLLGLHKSYYQGPKLSNSGHFTMSEKLQSQLKSRLSFMGEKLTLSKSFGFLRMNHMENGQTLQVLPACMHTNKERKIKQNILIKK